MLALTGLALAAWGTAVVLDQEPPGAPQASPPRPFRVGTGSRGALVMPARGSRRQPTVVFLHGWGLIGPEAYRPWLEHLAARGSTVIVPNYQTSPRTRSGDGPENAIAGIRSALRRIRPRPRSVVVVGHSAGGILAIDYAANARRRRLPPAAALMAIFPGGALRDMPSIPEAAPEELPASLRRLWVLASNADRVVGTAPAQAIVQSAAQIPTRRRRLLVVDDPAPGDHFAPVIDSPTARRAFWARLDQLLELAG